VVLALVVLAVLAGRGTTCVGTPSIPVQVTINTTEAVSAPRTTAVTTTVMMASWDRWKCRLWILYGDRLPFGYEDDGIHAAFPLAGMRPRDPLVQRTLARRCSNH